MGDSRDAAGHSSSDALVERQQAARKLLMCAYIVNQISWFFECFCSQ
jgi:hypothetical protein